ncbi:hypothetical protein ACMHYJ_14290 [Castellaniella hirudinis]|uniref:hypothetical protein n=1 Tax=Castellaniella hirudinis TaxID=1144617 RepID=UPI0039C0D89B
MTDHQNALAVSQGFSESTTTIASVETASTAIAAQSKAMVESRYIMAMRNPRNWDQVRSDLIKECKRPSFAHNKSAYYIKPIGNGVEGLGIRFVEVALRCMKNVLVETTMIFEDSMKEVHRVSVTDLEANITYPLDVRVSKTVERSKPNSDGSYISVRKNSWNKDVYTVEGTDDDILNKRGALISKAIRTIGLRIIPGDLCDEAEEIIKHIRLDKAAQDPDAERKKIVDAFAEINVTATDLTGYLGHDIGKCSPAQLVTLRGIYGAIRDGEATWQTVMQNHADESSGKAAPEPLSDEAFAKKSPGWKAMIESGKKTVNDLIATIQTKDILTEDQKVEIASWARENA